jgi:hypothetical protein
MLKKIFYILLLFISITAVGQRTNSSPYSFFGIGQQYSSQTVEQASMGGIGVAFSDTYHLNFLNPASIANLRFTTYTVGLLVNDLTIKDFSGSQKSTSTNLSYVNIGFPIGNKAGVSFGLKPNSSVGYSLFNISKDSEGSAIDVTRFYGVGGTNKIYGAFGLFVTKNLSVGVEAEYVFGKVENSVLFQESGVQLASKNTETLSLRGAGLKLGLHYKKELANKLTMSAGAVVKFENDIKSTGNEYLYSLVVQNSSFEEPRDTTYNSSTTGILKNPIRTSLGFGLGKRDKWYAGANYEFQNAIDLQGSLLSSSNTYSYGDSNKFSLGGFYLPKMNSISSYWNRVTYRAGVRFEKTGLLVNNTATTNGLTEINDFGMSFGLGLPLKGVSNLNLGVEYGKKGTTENNLIQENYFNFRMSISLNDIWFVKRRID